MKKVSIGLAALAMLVQGGIATAATQPVPAISDFGKGNSVSLGVASLGWADPAFSNKGWTHKSAWGQFRATKGQKVTLIVDGRTNTGLHPGLTVWFRPATSNGNKGNGLTYVPDHFYNQTSSWQVDNAVNDTTGEFVGTINMLYVTNGYDADNLAPGYNAQSSLKNGDLVGLQDGIPGYVTVSFVAAKTGVYQFVTGGISPYPVSTPPIDNSVKKLLPVTITVSTERDRSNY
ncbi:MAG: hypothetical protein RLZZ627_2041 [Pseudomonadota bacterium]